MPSTSAALLTRALVLCTIHTAITAIAVVPVEHHSFICSGPRHADAGIVGVVHAHDSDASTAVCGLVGEML